MAELTVNLERPTTLPFVQKIQKYRFSNFEMENIYVDTLEEARAYLEPLFKLIQIGEKNDKKEFALALSELLGADMSMPGVSFNMDVHETYTKCLKDQSLCRAEFFMEVGVRIGGSNGTTEPLFIVEFHSSKFRNGKVCLSPDLIASVEGSITNKLVEMLTKRSEHAGALSFSENPRRGSNDPIVAQMNEKTMGMMGMVDTTTMLTRSRLGELRNDLYENLDVEMLCEDFLNSEENLLVLSGDPGTGKTSVIKACIVKMWEMLNEDILNDPENTADTCDVDVLYIKDLRVIQSPHFWAHLSAHPEAYEILVFDDMDHVLKQRKDSEGKDSVTADMVNQLLSQSNGFVKNTIKIIVTTNLGVEHIDPAIIRPGRCYDAIKMPKMSLAHAKKLWMESFQISEELFPFTDAMIPQAALMSEVAKVNRKAPRYYLNGANYSVRTE